MQDTGRRNQSDWPRTAVSWPSTPCALLLGGDGPTRLMLRYLLSLDGCAVPEAASEQALVAVTPPACSTLLLVIVDDTAQHVLDVVARLHQRGYHTVTVVLTHAPTPMLRRRAFALGVQDVVPLPAEAHELRTHLRVALGHDAPAAVAAPLPPAIRAGGLQLDTVAHEVRAIRGDVAHLTRHETGLLGALMQRPGQSVSRQSLLDCLWGESAVTYINALNVCVHRVRRKLRQIDAQHGYIHTVRGHGYVFDARRVPRDERTMAQAQANGEAVAPVSQAR